MIKTQQNSDKIAMTLSMICVIHCFFVPSFLILGVGYLSLTIDNEFMHKAIVLLAIPISLYALLSGKRNHNNNLIFIVGVSGLTVLFLALFSEGNFYGFPLETLLTIIGSSIVISAHYKNYQICQRLDCACHE